MPSVKVYYAITLHTVTTTDFKTAEFAKHPYKVVTFEYVIWYNKHM